MVLYDIIYNWLYNYVFVSNDDSLVNQVFLDISGNQFQLNEWLCTLVTIIILALIILFFIKVTIWIFKFFGGLFKW